MRGVTVFLDYKNSTNYYIIDKPITKLCIFFKKYQYPIYPRKKLTLLSLYLFTLLHRVNYFRVYPPKLNF